MRYLDTSRSVISWSSEEIVIPYKSPIDGGWHRYFPDFYVKVSNAKGLVERYLVEVKPESQTMPPERRKRMTRKYLNEVATWGINSAKWEYARMVCAKKGWKFLILTEKSLNIKF